MEILVFATLLGLIPAAIAQSKGHSFFGFWIYGTLFLIIALPHSLLMSSRPDALDARKLRSGHRKCASCAELIRSEAKVCRYCGRDVIGASDVSEGIDSRCRGDIPEVRKKGHPSAAGSLGWASVALAFVVLAVVGYHRQQAKNENEIDGHIAASSPSSSWSIEVAASVANLRAQPRLDADVLATLVKGQTLTVHRWTGGWYESSVETDSGPVHGFIHESVVSE